MRRLLAAGIGAALLAVGCGGGGDGGPAGPQLPPQLAINSGNQVAVATATANVFMGLGTSSSVLPLSGGDRVSAAMAGDLLRKATKVTAAVLRPATDGRVTAQALISIPAPPGTCPDGGSALMTLDDRDNDGLADLGETITFVFNACRDGTDTVNGQMALTVRSVSDDGNQMSGDLAFTNLAASTSDATATLQGAVTIAITLQPNDGFSSALTVGATGLTSAVSAAGYSETLTFASGLTVTTAFDPTAMPLGGGIPGRTEISINGTVGSARLNGSFTIATITGVVQFDADPYPRFGEVLSTGAAGSRLRLRVIDPASVELALDADGNGSFEETTVRAWSDIL